MNIEEYISSGILEAYALGEVTPEQRQELERLLEEHEPLRNELSRIELTMEALAMELAAEPEGHLKEAILKKVKPAAKVVEMRPTFWKWAAAASIAVALTTSFLAYTYHERWKESSIALTNLLAQNQQMAQDYHVVNEKLDKIQHDFEVIENAAFTKVVMKGTSDAPEALATVYWNSGTQEVYLSIQNLRELSQVNQFQLWAIVDGAPVDAGVFDGDGNGLLKMKPVKGATAFAITIEPRGGNAIPSLGTMQVMGSLPKV